MVSPELVAHWPYSSQIARPFPQVVSPLGKPQTTASDGLGALHDLQLTITAWCSWAPYSTRATVYLVVTMKWTIDRKIASNFNLSAHNQTSGGKTIQCDIERAMGLVKRLAL